MPGLTPGHLSDLFVPLAGMRRVALAVSGGADSLALLLLAEEWSKNSGVGLVVYSVDHGLRPEASAEVAMVLDAAQRLGLAARGFRWAGPRPETGVQAAARAARYRLMADAMAEDGAEVLLTAHHLGDQAETVLMRLAHGSGIEGLRGMDRMAEVEGCRIMRPLLDTDPADLEEIVAEAGLTPVRDPSNGDRHYERVRWRQLLPQLEELGLDLRRIGTFARRMGDADAAIAADADVAFARLVHVGPDGDAEIPRAGLTTLPRIVAVRVLARALRLVGGDRRPYGLGAVESLRDRLAEGDGRAATLHGCVIASDGIAITLRREGARSVQSALTGD